MDIRETWLASVDWINLAHDGDRRRTFVNTAMNLMVP
jgi:hypothetical protein